jgi:poly(3-hydroxybutyrate) depolymerase
MLRSRCMLYPFHELGRLSFDAISRFTEAMQSSQLPWLRANAALLHRITKPYSKPAFGLTGEQVVSTHPFCRLLHFPGQGPAVLVCAPLSGHHATLVRDTVSALRADHDVYVTDWIDARDVPLANGTFSLDDYVSVLVRFISELDGPHVVAVCQPTVPALAATALLASRGAKTPRSLVLMGGPIDARVNPTVVCKLATDHPLAWFEQAMIHTVPATYAGAGRRVYPGFLQLTAFVMMHPDRHAQAYASYWMNRLRGDDAAATTHERFYDEYNAVLDMDAAYYLDTVRTVFQEFALARGIWRMHGELVEPTAITKTPVFAVEGELDDISSLGQTAAALALCSNAPHKRHHVAAGTGHYGLFSGSRWRDSIYPEVRAFIAESNA